jgi:hypothetical protein
MMYIHQSTCISPQLSFPEPDLSQLMESVENQLKVIEPEYLGIPAAVLRRMGKAVRIGVGAAIPLLKIAPDPAGIVMGTANGGMEDCIKFLNQIIQYDEGLLTPGNFVQSTPNAIAAQISLLNNNRSYNITHVHRGLAFENAMIDAIMLVKEQPALTYLIGAVDEISTYNFNIDYLGGWYKREKISNRDLYLTNSPASIAGEGAAMFLASGVRESACAVLNGIRIFHSRDQAILKAQLKDFLSEQLSPGEKIDLLISGENGDNRILPYYEAVEEMLDQDTGVARFKHMTGEFPTASALALWMACHSIQRLTLPGHMLKKAAVANRYNKILIYNNYKGIQHGFMLVSKPD